MSEARIQDLYQVLEGTLASVKPHERQLARRAFMRNFGRAGATLTGVSDYVRALFGCSLKRPERQWWEGHTAEEIREARQRLAAFQAEKGRCLLTDEQRKRLERARCE